MKTLLLWAALFAAVATLFGQFRGEDARNTIPYSEFMRRAEAGDFTFVLVEGAKLHAQTHDGAVVMVNAPQDVFMVPDLRKAGVEIEAKPENERSLITTIFISWFPMLLLIGVWVFFMRQMQGGGRGGAFSFGKSRARMTSDKENTVTFKDVAGCEEAKDEVAELVEFLRDPGQFRKLGAKIPRGVLLVGSPGTGKTLLARAIAGESQVPFFSISGSDFVEMFVGVGAARVRDMFEQAKKSAPCILFVDEVDAVGRQRGAGMGGGNDEREQTLNQLLVEMDGFEENLGVIVIAATNRPDVLDPALLRPGRFDRQVVVPLPDIRGREEIIRVHLRKVKSGKDVKPKVIARGTPGFAGADLANLVNEATLRAGREKRRKVSMRDFEYAKEKIIMGAERRSIVMPERERKNTAYHESGHAVVARLLPNTDPVHKVTIIPRGRALGLTMQLPQEDRYNMTRDLILDNICVLLGGRVAEELFMKQMTTGASNDFERATTMARRMVTQWGMSDALGAMVYGEEESEIFLGRSVTTHKQVSDATMLKVDAEIRQIIDAQYAKATRLLEENRPKVERMARALLEWETIDENQVDAIMANREPEPPEETDEPDPGEGAESLVDDDEDEAKAAGGAESEKSEKQGKRGPPVVGDDEEAKAA